MPRNPHPGDLRVVLRINRLCRAAQPDVLHGHGAKGGAYARLAFWPGGRPIRVYTPHGGSFHFAPGSLRHGLYMTPERLLAARTDLFLFESDYVAGRFDAFVGRTNRLSRVNRNGVAEAEFEPIARSADPYDLVFIGELRDLKGIDTLIDAVAILRNRGTRLRLLIVGSGPSQDDLGRQARDRGVSDAVTFAPPQPIRQALAQGRIMVAPSRAESLPYVLLEAAAAAQPIVATNVGGIPEIFGPFAHTLVPPNDPLVLADAVANKLAQPEEKRLAQAQALTAWVRDRFLIDRMVEGALAGYDAAFRRLREVEPSIPATILPSAPALLPPRADPVRD